jgi:hypothetical protein
MKSSMLFMIWVFVMMGLVSAENQNFRRVDPTERVVKRDGDYECGRGAFGGVVSSITPFVFMLTM